MRKLITLFILCALLLALAAPLMAQQAGKPASLYKRLGGYDAIAAVTDDMMGRFAADPQLARFFAGHNAGSLKVIRQHIVDFLCQTTGGPCQYHGQDMKTAHAGLNINEQDWLAAVNDIKATLAKFKVPEKETGEVLSAIGGLHNDIVTAPAAK